MGARKGEVRETGRGGGPGVGEAALAEGEGLERGGGEEWVGERAVAPLGRADERDLAGAAVAGREVAEPGLRGGDAGAEGGAGEAEARDGARVGGERQRGESTAVRAASAVSRREMIAERSSNGRLLMKSLPPASHRSGGAISPRRDFAEVWAERFCSRSEFGCFQESLETLEERKRGLWRMEMNGLQVGLSQ